MQMDDDIEKEVAGTNAPHRKKKLRAIRENVCC